MNKLIIILLLVLTVISCARLDDNLFAPEKLSEYKWEEYQGERELDVPADFSVSSDQIQLIDLQSGPDKIQIKAVFIGDKKRLKEDADYQVILYCHGNSKHLDNYWNRIKLLANVGVKYQYGVLAVDYRGYGMSQGEPSEAGLYEDVDAAMQWLQSQGVTEDRLFIYGYSMGTAPTVELATSPRTLKPAKVILEAPFASAEVMVQDSTVIALPSSFVTNLEINNAERIRSMTQPLLWFHGTRDDFLSIKTHGEVVFKNHPGVEGVDKFPQRIKGAAHNNIPQVIAEQNNGFQTYLDIVETFLSR